MLGTNMRRAFIELDELWGQAQASDYSTHSRRVWAFWFFRQAHGRPLSTRGWGVDWLLRKHVICTRAFIELDELWGQAQASDYSTHSRRVWALQQNVTIIICVSIAHYTFSYTIQYNNQEYFLKNSDANGNF
ncbi:Hypothetical_protein [Hexamita inflata]|uniref:Hypothetical_protein n=1 Tax=Hexamita inflata TaxID=28002 RepID=A0ABP1JHU9_9EUKA